MVFAIICFLSFSGIAMAVETDSLFTAAGSEAAHLLPDMNPERVLRQRAVHIDFELFAKGEPEFIRLNLFDDIILMAVLDKIANGPAGEIVWHGHIENRNQSKVIFVVKEQALSGAIVMPLQIFKIRPLDDGVHMARQVTESLLANELPSSPEYSNNKALSAISVEYEVLSLVNEERNDDGLHNLSWNQNLFASARAHSEDMANQDYFSHTGLDGRTPDQRIADAGYDARLTGENIAAGYSTPTEVMAGWMTSPGHRANILDVDYCEIGVGYGYNSSSYYGYYWTQNFGRQSGVDQCNADNEPPLADFTAHPTAGQNPLRVEFDGSASSDPDGTIISYQWDFGDNAGASGVQVQHTYNVPGNYTVKLTVTDNGGDAASVTKTDLITVEPAQDTDSDGMPSHEEMGPDGDDANYDGNQDGLPDHGQANVASGHTYDGANYVTLAVSDGVRISNCRFSENPSTVDAPVDTGFELGFFAFEINDISPGDAISMQIYLPDTVSAADAYYKYGPTPDNQAPHWYAFDYDGETGADINGQKITLYLVDGLRGDDDLDSANGIIVDIGGPATSATTQLPAATGSGGGGGCFINSVQ